MSADIILGIIISSIATYSSRFLGTLTSEIINENSKIYRWFNCLAYSTLAALISRVLIFPNGDLIDTTYLARIIVIVIAILIFYYTKKNLVYPTVFSAIILSIINSYF
jgi:branched-subunit amino acid transport protein|tara:strand:- start:298 stop:621 length:324 start_codon:yes stop_codon:yes gene_type:complete